MRVFAGKPHIAGAKYEALHALPTGMEGNAGPDQMAIVLAARCVEEVKPAHRGPCYPRVARSDIA
jgi:hypothetical protein